MKDKFNIGLFLLGLLYNKHIALWKVFVYSMKYAYRAYTVIAVNIVECYRNRFIPQFKVFHHDGFQII